MLTKPKQNAKFNESERDAIIFFEYWITSWANFFCIFLLLLATRFWYVSMLSSQHKQTTLISQSRQMKIHSSENAYCFEIYWQEIVKKKILLIYSLTRVRNHHKWTNFFVRFSCWTMTAIWLYKRWWKVGHVTGGSEFRPCWQWNVWSKSDVDEKYE